MIRLNDIDSARELAVMLAALEGSGQLDSYQSSVVDNVMTSCYNQEPAIDPEDVDAEADKLKKKLYTGWI